MLRLAFDPNQVCVGCHLCEVACSRFHYEVFNPKKAHIRVVSVEPGVDGAVACYQCRKFPCGRRCPTQAIYWDEANSMVAISEEKCIGCGLCVEDCPFGAIRLDTGTGLAVKCDLCGGKPQCVGRCPTGVLKMGTDELISQARRRSHVAQVWRPRAS